MIPSLRFSEMTPAEAELVMGIRNAAAQGLTERFGVGRWSGQGTLRGAIADLRQARIWLAWDGDEPVATWRLSTRKPWAIDASRFSPARRPLYLTSMAVHPGWQRQGDGRACVREGLRQAAAWPGDAVRLDAFDAVAGAGPFYARCGFREVGKAVYKGTPLLYFEWVLPSAEGGTPPA
jgi:GNAT superfamily N-acetyltransferase